MTALLLALCVLFQSLRTLIPGLATMPLVNQLIIGSLVNLTLIIAAWAVGFWSGAAVSVLAAVISYFQGHIPIIHLVPLIAAGNIVIVAVVWFFRSHIPAAGIIIGAAAKAAFLWLGIVKILLPIASKNALLKGPAIEKLSLMFSWPQLITALTGGLLALIIWSRIKLVAKKDE